MGPWERWNLAHAHQGAYYQAIQDSPDEGSTTPFIQVMLDMKRLTPAGKRRVASPSQE
jgi:hypothetical protein